MEKHIEKFLKLEAEGFFHLAVNEEGMMECCSAIGNPPRWEGVGYFDKRSSSVKVSFLQPPDGYRGVSIMYGKYMR